MEPKSASVSPQQPMSPRSPNKPLPVAPAMAGGPQKRLQKMPKRSSSRDMLQAQSKSSPGQRSITEKDASPAQSVKPVKQANASSPAQSSDQPKTVTRRVSFSERTRSLTKKLSFFKDRDGNEPLKDSPLIQKPSSRESPNHRSISLTPSADAPPRKTETQSPIESTKPPQSQSSNEDDSFLPIQSTISPIIFPSPSFRRAQSPSPSQSIQSPSDITTVMIGLLDDSEGSINHAHPLLMDRRFSKTTPVTPARSTARDLPLRHYRSQDTLQSQDPSSTRQSSAPVPPKRTSSLRNSPTARFSPFPQISANSSPLTTTLSPPPAQSSATPSPLRVPSRPLTAIGPNPAPENAPNNVSTPAPANVNANANATGNHTHHASASSASSLGATPPPIIHLPVLPPISTSPLLSLFPTSNHSPPTTLPNLQPRTRHIPRNDLPTTVKPASSAALIQFLSSSPPTSPKTPRTVPPQSATAASAIYRKTHTEPLSSPPPPAPGGVPKIPRDLTPEKKGGWKKVFAVVNPSHKRDGGSGKRDISLPVIKIVDKKAVKAERTKRKEKRSASQGAAASATAIAAGANGNGTAATTTGEAGFMGLGKDGVWISRKNFLKT